MQLSEQIRKTHFKALQSLQVLEDSASPPKSKSKITKLEQRNDNMNTIGEVSRSQVLLPSIALDSYRGWQPERGEDFENPLL